MKVILKEDVNKKGQRFDIIDVTAGYANNFLFANDLAIPVNKANLKWLANCKKRITDQKQSEHKEALDLAKQLKGIVLNFILARHGNQVSNSISNKQIVDQLKYEHNIKLDKRKFNDHNNLNIPGRYFKKIKLHPEVTAELEISIQDKAN